MKTMSLAIVTLAFLGCSTPSSPDPAAQRAAALAACGLDHDPSITADTDVGACDPDNARKTTICHIPPGNPANAHTLCVGNAAVPAHVDHHHDTVGPCDDEPTCDPGIDAGVPIDAGSDDGSIIL